MTVRRGRIAEALVATAAGLLLAAAAAPGHGSEFYPATWKQEVGTVDFRFVSSFPAGAFRDRARNAASRWNGVGEPMRFVEGGNPPAPYDPYNCGSIIDEALNFQRDGLQYGSIDGGGGVAARVVGCTKALAPTELWSFNMLVDSAENWYTGTGSPGGSQIDALAYLTHEFGHATGFSGPFAGGHFDPASSICARGTLSDRSQRQTMCTPGDNPGEDFQRSLEAHDVHTFQGGY